MHLTFRHPVGSMCPTARTLEEDVEQLEGRKIFTTHAEADVVVQGRVDDLATGVHVRLEARTAEGAALGTRELSAPAGQCASLRPALALVLTMLIDPDDAPKNTRRRAERPWQLGASGGLWVGTLPRATGGAGLTVGYRPSARVLLRGDGSYWAPVTIETTRGLGAELRAFSFGLVACPRLSRDRSHFSAWLCAGTELGQLSASPHMLQHASRHKRLLAQAVVELKLAARLFADTWLELSLGPYAALARPQVSYQRSDGTERNVYRPAAIGGIFRVTLIIDRL